MSNKKWDTDWLNFSKRARRGALVFLFLFVVISLLPSLYWNYFHEDDIAPQLIALNDDLQNKNKQNKSSKNSYNIPRKPFDPNDYSKQDWVNLGLSNKQAQTIINYMTKGGILKYKEDVKKLYVIDEELYGKLEPYIALPRRSLAKENTHEAEIPTQNDENSNGGKPSSTYMEEEKKPVKINSATKDELTQIKGIGDFYADAIIEIREQYGGIYQIDQLKGLYKMTPGKLDSLSAFLIIDLENIKRIDVNTASKSVLNEHPLINMDEANSIVFIRKRFGKYEALDDLLQSPYIDQKKLEELRPYITL